MTATATAGRLARRLLAPFVRENAGKPRAILPDPQWIWRGNPGFPGHDGRGFRNRSALERATVLIVGNSQTYGKTLAAEESWPWKLRSAAAGEAYSAAVNGWSFLQYREAYRLHRALRPELLLVGVFSGFDFSETFTALRTSSFPRALADRACLESIAPPDFSATERSRSRLHALVNAGLDRKEALRQLGREGGANALEARLGDITYFLQAEWRRASMDLGNPAVAAGFERAMVLLAEIAALCREDRCRLALLLIPTKERLLSAYAGPAVCADRSRVAEVGALEAVLADRIAAEAGKLDAEVVDLAPRLLTELPEIFAPDSENGHYNRRGTGLIAGIVDGLIARLQCAGPRT